MGNMGQRVYCGDIQLKMIEMIKFVVKGEGGGGGVCGKNRDQGNNHSEWI